MSGTIHPTFVTYEHPYTRSDEPWQMDQYTEACGCTATGRVYSWKLFHYISGGGMRIFGRTIRQEVRSRRQSRFLIFAGVLFALWLVLLVF